MIKVKKLIEVVAVEIDGKITNDKELMYNLIKWKDAKPQLIRREVFSFMEACDLWREKELSKLPAMYVFTQEKWDEARKLGIANG
jgi:hypothetical protein